MAEKEKDPEPTGEPICSCGNKKCEWTYDPYAAEINDEYIWDWWCESCRQDRADDI